jgi:asparagine synthase (glutamine-hydrolysing)
MCGIYGYFQFNGKKITVKQRNHLFKQFIKSQHRGPEHNVFKNIGNNAILGFHRLCIVDIERGTQPFHDEDDKIFCICNGEIYNHEQLRKEHNLVTRTHSDCEVVLHLYTKYGHEDGGIEKIVNMLDGVFSFIVYDTRGGINDQQIFIGHDPIGVRSLYYSWCEESRRLYVSSELKSIVDEKDKEVNKNLKMFPAGSYGIFSNDSHGPCFFTSKYYDPYKLYKPIYTIIDDDATPLSEFNVVKQNVKILFENAVRKRLMSDRPIGCLLSGGLDSSLVCALVAKMMKENGSTEPLHTFSIGMEGGTDLKYAKMVADHIGSIHHEVTVTKEQMLEQWEKTPYDIESWDTTTVRASTPMILLCEYIKNETDVIVIYSGEGADEASGSYMYFHKAPTLEEFQTECVRLMDELQYFDVLRCDKSTAAAGLEVRVPFLDKDFLQYYMTLDPKFKHPKFTKNIEKYLLRSAFDGENLLPKEVLWRTKEAFSDGCSSVEDSWYEIIQKHCQKTTTLCLDEYDYYNGTSPPYSSESRHIRHNYIKHYPYSVDTIPHYWMPRWSDTNEVSARALDTYQERMKDTSTSSTSTPTLTSIST